jgi:hypothetical protein
MKVEWTVGAFPIVMKTFTFKYEIWKPNYEDLKDFQRTAWAQ